MQGFNWSFKVSKCTVWLDCCWLIRTRESCLLPTKKKTNEDWHQTCQVLPTASERLAESLVPLRVIRYWDPKQWPTKLASNMPGNFSTERLLGCWLWVFFIGITERWGARCYYLALVSSGMTAVLRGFPKHTPYSRSIREMTSIIPSALLRRE